MAMKPEFIARHDLTNRSLFVLVFGSIDELSDGVDVHLYAAAVARFAFRQQPAVNRNREEKSFVNRCAVSAACD